ncbi:AAA family ATPase [Calothrix sp. 336/3]|uniref:AAA family ATPase n=1 Tax=Calothrix sp. 336/3 TaxID=1337936 RepID=UPI0004E2C4AC|nr:AAA family ATPase [Calothrix sp. 336/3]AKG21340.1 ATPase AAA [Calothrix sp. 336/3]
MKTLSDLNLLMDSGVPIICINTQIQERINLLRKIYVECTARKNIPLYLWTTGWGCLKLILFRSNHKIDYVNLHTQYQTLFTSLDYLLDSQEPGVFLFENLLSANSADISKISSHLVNIYFELENNHTGKHLIIISNDDVQLPDNLSRLIPSISMPLPSRGEISDIVDDVLILYSDFDNSDNSILVNASSGLTQEEIRLGLKLSLNSLDKPTINILAKQLLEYKINHFRSFNLNFVGLPNAPDFGGLDLLKQYIENVKYDFLPQARTANIPLPKGCLLVGPPGTGKTLAASAIASILTFPLIRVDTAAVVAGGAIYLKQLLERVEACAPVVLYFDELDKLFAASNESGEDIGSRQILGTLLTWLQDKTSMVFVVATLNRLDSLPPELTRVGRFDEIFYVGFPQAIERKQILMLHLARFDERYKNGDVMTPKEWRIILNQTVNCTGAELAQIVEKAARALFYQQREMEIGLQELLEQREMMVPLYVRDTDRILAIENRAKYICQPASSTDTSEFAPIITSFWGEK